MKVLVTGASGFIGSALCDSLLVRGDTVVGLTRDPQQARGTNPGVNWHPWEPLLERPPEAAFENVDGVIHLLGEKINQRWTPEAKERILESRRTGTHNLIGTISALEHKPKVLVSQSAIGFYGDRGEAMVDESSPRARASTPRWCGSGRRQRARSPQPACAWRSSAPATCSIRAAASSAPS